MSKSLKMIEAIDAAIAVLSSSGRDSECVTLSDADRRAYGFADNVKRAVIVQPDNVEQLTRINAELAKRDAGVILRVCSGFDDGSVKTLAVYADTFKTFGFDELASGLSVSNLKDRKHEFARATLGFRACLYGLNGSTSRYRMKNAAAEMSVVVHKLTDRRNVYALGVESLGEAVKSAQDTIARQRAEFIAKQAERDAKQAAKAEKSTVSVAPSEANVESTVKPPKMPKSARKRAERQAVEAK